MAAVTAPETSSPLPARPSGWGRRRRLLIVIVAVWTVVVAGLAVWSVGRDPATVPEQRDIAQALPELRQAVGVVFAAAGGPGRAVVLGDLTVSQECRVTPVRAGVIAVRDVRVYLRAGEARAGVEAIAAALPESYRVEVTSGRGGTEFALHGDAGNFIGVDGDLNAGEQVLTLRVSSGCRPLSSGQLDKSDPATGPAPAALGAALAALGAPGVPAGSPGPSGSAVPGVSPSLSGAKPSPAQALAVRAVACPDGGTAGTYTVDGVAAPADLGRSLRGVASGASVIRSGSSGWAYRTGNDSVVVLVDGKRLRVSATTAC